MENKIELQLSANYSNKKIKSAIISSILCDYIIDKLSLAIKKFNQNDIDLFYVYENFKQAIEKGEDVTFSSIDAWAENKASVYQDCMNVVVALDDVVSKAGLIKSGDLIEEISNDCQSYSILLGLSDITTKYADFGDVDVKDEHIDNMLAQLIIVDEGQFLSDLSTMRMEMIPLEVNKYRNKFVEQKLKRARAIVDNVAMSLDKDFDDLLESVCDAYDKCYKVVYATMDDVDKVEAVRKICKLVLPHRQLLDKLENKFTEANELKRQLTIHEKKLKEQKDSKFEEFDRVIQEKPYELESINRLKDSLSFVTEVYLENIADTKLLIDEVAQEMTDGYDMLDRVEVSLKASVPTENEMKRYSSLVFKFEDLYTRLETAKSQHKDKGKDFLLAVKTACSGLLILAELCKEGKDVFLRNTLLSAIFNSVNSIYDLVNDTNKSVEISQASFVTTRLVQYSSLDKVLVKNLQTFRHVCNNAIRDIAMIMGKPFSVAMVMEVVDAIELATKQIEEFVTKLNDNHVEQVRVLGQILSV